MSEVCNSAQRKEVEVVEAVVDTEDPRIDEEGAEAAVCIRAPYIALAVRYL